MQVYGFARIYDVKVGSTKLRITANWDWLIGASVGLQPPTSSVSKDRTGSEFLARLWYHSYGVEPPFYVEHFGWICLAVSVFVLVGFLVNLLIQTRRGPQPNPAKLLMLASGIGFWRFAMVFVENPILGVALFEVFHDVQYLSIVWLFNCRRVNSNPDVGAFMRFLFRRGMLIVYVALVFAYGLIGLAPRLVLDGTFQSIFTGIVTTSTILHFYSDGFIWKVREKSTQANLGMTTEGTAIPFPKIAWGGFHHILKWCPLILFISWPFITDWTLATNKISRGDQDNEVIEFLETLVRQFPSNAGNHRRLGEIYQKTGEFQKANDCFLTSLAHSKTIEDRTLAHHRLGETHLALQQPDLAIARFHEALQDDPEFVKHPSKHLYFSQ